MPGKVKHIFVVSDATGQTCERVAKAALAQFEGQEAELHKKPYVRSPEEVEGILREAKKLDGIVVYTLVCREERREMVEKSRQMGVPAIDIMGPLLRQFSVLLEIDPAELPGLFQDLIEE